MLPAAFLTRMERLLGPEYPAFLQSYDLPRHVGLRFNPLKTDAPPALPAFGLTPVPWEPNGYFYDPAARPGLSPFHEAGLYYLQEPSAMAPAGLLDVRPGMRVLDLCAAPGGKSTQLAAALRGQGLLVSNEIHPKRAKILARNVERQRAGPQRASPAAGPALPRLLPPRPGGRPLLRRGNVPQGGGRCHRLERGDRGHVRRPAV